MHRDMIDMMVQASTDDGTLYVTNGKGFTIEGDIDYLEAVIDVIEHPERHGSHVHEYLPVASMQALTDGVHAVDLSSRHLRDYLDWLESWRVVARVEGAIDPTNPRSRGCLAWRLWTEADGIADDQRLEREAQEAHERAELEHELARIRQACTYLQAAEADLERQLNPPPPPPEPQIDTETLVRLRLKEGARPRFPSSEETVEIDGFTYRRWHFDQIVKALRSVGDSNLIERIQEETGIKHPWAAGKYVELLHLILSKKLKKRVS